MLPDTYTLGECSTPSIFDEPTGEIAAHVLALVVVAGPTWRGTSKDDEVLRELRRHAEELARRTQAFMAFGSPE